MLDTIAVQFRYLQLYAHIAHNISHGSTFYQDHDVFGDLYGKYEEEYDMVVEHMIGLGVDFCLFEVTDRVNTVLQENKPDDVFNELFFQNILSGELLIQGLVKECNDHQQDYTVGTINMLAQMSEDSENRCYRIQQRIKLIQ
jgi:DNA-binding ferritin-like protein